MAVSNDQYKKACEWAMEYYSKAGIVITSKEKENIEVADFGLGNLGEIGIEVITYVNAERSCAKEVVLFPGQICPEHRHPPINAMNPGKEETFRCRWGEVYLYVEGEAVTNPKAKVPEARKKNFTVWNEVILRPGDQYTLRPNLLHWFQGGPKGAVVSEFSTKSIDEADIFTDSDIKRLPEVK